MVAAGAALTRKLDELGWPVAASLWFLFTDVEQWKLILASPEVADKGPREAYKVIRDAISGLPEEEPHVSLQDILVIDPRHPLVQLMSAATGTGPDLSQMRLSQNGINGTLIEDALIYRMHLQAA